MTNNRPLLRSVAALLIIFLGSFALYLFVPGHLVRTILYFPHEITHKTVPEVRSLPFNGNRDHDSQLLVREILLGPADYDHLRLFSREGTLLSVFVQGKRVFVDLSKSTLFPDKDVLYSPAKALRILRSTIKRNIPGVSEVKVSFGGDPAELFHVDKG